MPTSKAHVLHPGDVVCADHGARLETLLGSCVAIILTDPRRTVGAMCHIVHASKAPHNARKDASYADVALATMYSLLRGRGITPKLCEAYVYGGGNMFPDLYPNGAVGDRNARWALDALAHDGVHVLHHHVGGSTYRRLSWKIGSSAPRVTAVPV